MCLHFSSFLLLSLPASTLVILNFIVGIFPSIHFDFVLLLEYLPFPFLSVLICGSPLFLPLACQCCLPHINSASYPPVLITVLSKHYLSRRNCFTHVKLQNILGNVENCPLPVTSSSLHSSCNVQTHVSSTIHRDC